MNKFRIVIETMGDGSERISIEEQRSRPAVLPFLAPGQEWRDIVWNSAAFEIVKHEWVVNKFDLHRKIVFYSVADAKLFIDAVLARRKARTVVDTNYEEYPQ